MEQQNPSPLRCLWRYLRTKSRNAFWVLKTKGLPGVWKNLKTEILFLSGRYQAQQTAPPSQSEAPIPVRPVPDSAFVNRRKVLPRTAIPTRSRLEPLPELTIDRATVAHTLQRIKEELQRSNSLQARVPHEE